MTEIHPAPPPASLSVEGLHPAPVPPKKGAKPQPAPPPPIRSIEDPSNPEQAPTKKDKDEDDTLKEKGPVRLVMAGQDVDIAARRLAYEWYVDDRENGVPQSWIMKRLVNTFGDATKKEHNGKRNWLSRQARKFFMRNTEEYQIEKRSTEVKEVMQNTGTSFLSLEMVKNAAEDTLSIEKEGEERQKAIQREKAIQRAKSEALLANVGQQDSALAVEGQEVKRATKELEQSFHTFILDLRKSRSNPMSNKEMQDEIRKFVHDNWDRYKDELGDFFDNKLDCILFFSNMAEQIQDAEKTHENGLNQIELYLAKTHSGSAGKIETGLSKVMRSLKRSRIHAVAGLVSSPLVSSSLALGVGLSGVFGKSAMNLVAAPLFTGATFAAFRRGREAKFDWWQHEAHMAEGYNTDNEAAEKMKGREYQAKSVQEMRTQIELATTPDAQITVVAEILERISIKVQRGANLIKATDAEETVGFKAPGMLSAGEAMLEQQARVLAQQLISREPSVVSAIGKQRKKIRTQLEEEMQITERRRTGYIMNERVKAGLAGLATGGLVWGAVHLANPFVEQASNAVANRFNLGRFVGTQPRVDSDLAKVLNHGTPEDTYDIDTLPSASEDQQIHVGLGEEVEVTNDFDPKNLLTRDIILHFDESGVNPLDGTFGGDLQMPAQSADIAYLSQQQQDMIHDICAKTGYDYELTQGEVLAQTTTHSIPIPDGVGSITIPDGTHLAADPANTGEYILVPDNASIPAGHAQGDNYFVLAKGITFEDGQIDTSNSIQGQAISFDENGITATEQLRAIRVDFMPPPPPPVEEIPDATVVPGTTPLAPVQNIPIMGAVLSTERNPLQYKMDNIRGQGKPQQEIKRSPVESEIDPVEDADGGPLDMDKVQQIYRGMVATERDDPHTRELGDALSVYDLALASKNADDIRIAQTKIQTLLLKDLKNYRQQESQLGSDPQKKEEKEEIQKKIKEEIRMLAKVMVHPWIQDMQDTTQSSDALKNLLDTSKTPDAELRKKRNVDALVGLLQSGTEQQQKNALLVLTRRPDVLSKQEVAQRMIDLLQNEANKSNKDYEYGKSLFNRIIEVYKKNQAEAAKIIGLLQKRCKLRNQNTQDTFNPDNLDTKDPYTEYYYKSM